MAVVIVKWVIFNFILSAFTKCVDGEPEPFDYIVDCSACQAGNFSMVAFVSSPVCTFEWNW